MHGGRYYWRCHRLRPYVLILSGHADEHQCVHDGHTSSWNSSSLRSSPALVGLKGGPAVVPDQAAQPPIEALGAHVKPAACPSPWAAGGKPRHADKPPRPIALVLRAAR